MKLEDPNITLDTISRRVVTHPRSRNRIQDEVPY